MTQPQPLSTGTSDVRRHVLIGLAMMTLGATLYAARRDVWDLDWWGGWWALALIAAGLARFVWPGVKDGCRQSRRFGVWLMGVGVWGWVSQQRLFGLEFRTSWPFLVILAGVLVVWQAISESAARRRPRGREN